MKGRATSVACLAVSAVVFTAFLVFNGTVPRFVFVQRIKQLEAQNEKLRGDIRALAVEVGGSVVHNERLYLYNDGDSQREPYDEGIYQYSRSRQPSRCATVHIAIVASGYNTSRAVATLIKSILFYRHNPLHLHFISNPHTRYSLGTLFRTWGIPALRVSFYPTDPAQTNVSWIPNMHYSGVYGLMKLTLTNILPPQIERVVVLDTDLMLVADIAVLWQYFERIRKKRKLFGLVENQSDWYLGKLWESHRPWPAVGRGFNTGVMLLDLQAMRRRGWQEMWRRVTTAALGEYRSTALADQDIINTLIKENPDVHYILPCAWNVQLSEHSLSEYCYKDVEDFKVIHWNSPKKLDVSNNHGPHFRNLYRTFLGYDGNLLRDELLSCGVPSPQDEKLSGYDSSDPCLDFRIEVNMVHRTHPFFTDFDYTPTDPTDITLVSQLSMDRLQMLESLCHHWEGPMSITLYASDSEAQQFLQYFYNSPALKSRKNIGFHIVYRGSRFYPVNYLRNVALENARTNYVFLSDIDFLPMFGLYSYVKEAIRVLGMEGERRALIIPAFETLLYRFDYPKNKGELLQMLVDNTVYTFRYHVWPEGHAPTNYDHWKTAAVPYRITWAPDFEPYVAVSSNVTRYDTRFVGFGWNKVSHIMELEAQGYEFVVLPDAFTVHMPHAPSPDISNFRGSKHYRDCEQVMKREFQEELDAKYRKLTHHQ